MRKKNLICNKKVISSILVIYVITSIIFGGLMIVSTKIDLNNVCRNIGSIVVAIWVICAVILLNYAEIKKE